MPKYRVPTQEQVEATLLKIPTFQLRRVFYEGLENPLWVRPLLQAGAFTNPPEPQATDDGYLRDVYWPEISYLTRIAPQAPGDVVDGFSRLVRRFLPAREQNSSRSFKLGCQAVLAGGPTQPPWFHSRSPY
jgi:hypothetical protein